MLACLDCPVNKQVKEVKEGEAGGWYWNDPSGGPTLAAKIPWAIESPRAIKKANKTSRLRCCALVTGCGKRKPILEIS